MSALAAPGNFNVELTDREYMEIAEFVHKTAGINLKEGKKELMRTRLSKRMRSLRFNHFKDYFRYVMSDQSGEEIVFLLDALATNLTSFFREPQHFRFMAEEYLPALEERRRARNNRRLRIWSAACSSGEEPYTAAMVVLEKNPYFGQGGDFRILATDLSTKVLNIAKQGLYGPERVKGIPPQTLQKYFTRLDTGGGGKMYKVSDQLRRLVAFKRLNLVEPMPFKNPLDLIFCRNVMIYFDRETINRLVDKYYQILAPGGYLFIGHSESLSGFKHPFKYVAPCIYLKE
ncbi:MAG: protein-glutamate O-methyltransferase CheR [Candidatus Adiutrix sp.]|jgi:chemotaxis protein methyltransferase CheR|nr:protein-glutamate O-methyltransferase CheR [Candidatus Adiutrix sp.]